MNDRKTRTWIAALNVALGALVAIACGSEPDSDAGANPSPPGGEGGVVDGSSIAPDAGGEGGGPVYTCVEAGAPMSGETCAEAIDVSCGGTFTGTTTGAKDDYQTCNTGGVAANDRAYVIHSSIDQTFTIRVEPSASTPDYDIAVHVKRDCSKMFECLSESMIKVDDAPRGSVVNVFDLRAGETAFVIVDGVLLNEPQHPNGDYTLTVTPSTPAGTKCADAIDVSAGGSFGSTTLGAGDDTNGAGCSVQKAGEDRIYSLMTKESQTIELRLDTTSGSGTSDLAIYVRTDCNAASCVPETKNGALGSPTRLLLTTAPGVRYYVVVDGKMEPGVNYILHVDPHTTCCGAKPPMGSVARN